MKLNENTLQVLRNFSTINPSLVVDEGNVIRTIAEAKNVYASATIPDTFTQKFGIYDLSELLKVLDLMEDPDFSPADDYATISDGSGRSRIKYYFTDVDMLTYPSKEPKLPSEWEINFTLDSSTLGRIKSASGALGHKEVRITPENGILSITVCDSENKTSNTFSIDVPGNFKGDKFEIYLHIDNLKRILAGTYEVNISSKLISKFKSTNTDLPIEYLVALEKNSKYGE